MIGNLSEVFNFKQLFLMPQSHQNFGMVTTVIIMGIMFINRCRPTTFHTHTIGDANDGVKTSRCDQPLKLKEFTWD